MTSHVTLDDSVQGNRVISADGEEIGVITAVRNDTAYVDPDPNITDKIQSMIGWDDVDEGDYPLPDGSIDRVTDDEVHLRSEF